MKRIFLLLSALFALGLFMGTFASCDNSSDGVPAVAQKQSDWLFLFYSDADDDVLNDDLYGNVREMEYALSQMRNADGTPKGDYPSVTALVLWDGISVEKREKQKYLHPDGALYELGADYNLDYTIYSGENKYQLGSVHLKGKDNLGDNFIVGANTIDRTLQARAEGLLDQEPNMSDYKTLEKFLKFAKAHYDATNVVLCLDDHGSGTYKETYTDSAAVSKTLCTDSTNGGERMLTCQNVKDALTAAGYVGSQKLKVLINDVCLQSSAEILWNYKGFADYYVASPNLAVSQDFVRVFTKMYKDMTPRDFGKIFVSAYHERYYAEPQDCPKTAEIAKDRRASGYSLFTFSLLSLDEQKANKLQGAVDNFAAALLDLKNSDDTKFKKVFDDYVDQDPNSFADCKGLAYHGSYAFLSDLGWLAKEVAADTSLPDDVTTAATEIKTLLKHGDENLIVYAWAGKMARAENIPKWENITANQLYLTGGKDFISDQTVTVERSEDIYGLTIASSAVYPDTKNDILPNYYDWTGFSSKWGEVIKAWREFY